MDKNVCIASYNMSFASDIGNLEKMHNASEAAFLTSNTGHGRAYWENAKELLFNFIRDHHNNSNIGGLMIGLQEMNKTSSPESGTGSIEYTLSKVFPGDYTMISEEVISTHGKPALSVIYTTNKFGEHVHHKIVNTLEGDNGRPILMVYTKNNYLFVCAHGGQGGPEKNKNYITREVSAYIAENNLNYPRIFIVGDFNDRYDGIKEIEINNTILTYKGESPYSCCHNWDSSCDSNTPMKPFLWPGQSGDHPNQQQCDFDPSKIRENNVKIALPGERGHVKNYRYKGDKVFGEMPISIINMYHGKNGKGLSVESDHELVYAYFNPSKTYAGGKARKSTKRQKRKSTKKRSKKRSVKSKKRGTKSKRRNTKRK